MNHHCTGWSASWCPVHDTCDCPKGADGGRLIEDVDCPLHGLDSDHGEERTPAYDADAREP